MEFFEVIKKRRCIRKFEDKDVSDEQINILLDSARWAPSAGNLQSWFFVVVRDQKVKSQLAKAALFQMFIKNASIIIVSCADIKRSSILYRKRGRELYAIQDATIATQNIFLTATSLGLGACWVGAFNEEKVQEILSLKKHLRPVVIMPIGYPLEIPNPPRRRKLDKISKIV